MKKKNSNKSEDDLSEDILSPEDVTKTLKTLIDNLLECERNCRDCRKCKLRNDGCLKFIRDSVAVALQFILVGLDPVEPKKIETGMFM